MNTAHNDTELKNMLLPALEKAAEYTADEILKTNKEKIQTWVYNVYRPKEYQRTDDFKERAWSTDVATKNSSGGDGSVIATMEYDPKGEKNAVGMRVGRKDLGQHTSIVDGSDVRDRLVNIIYQGLAGYIFGEGAWTQGRDAWSQLEKTLEKNYGLASYIEKGMRKAGLKFKVNNRNFNKTVTYI